MQSSWFSQDVTLINKGEMTQAVYEVQSQQRIENSVTQDRNSDLLVSQLQAVICVYVTSGRKHNEKPKQNIEITNGHLS